MSRNSGSLNLLETPGPIQACKGSVLLFYFFILMLVVRNDWVQIGYNPHHKIAALKEI
jgi:hypothetical protein